MDQSIERTVLLEEPPEIEYRGGLFYVSDPMGSRAYRPATFIAIIAKAVEQSRLWRPGGQVVPLFSQHQAASASGSPSK